MLPYLMVAAPLWLIVLIFGFALGRAAGRDDEMIERSRPGIDRGYSEVDFAREIARIGDDVAEIEWVAPRRPTLVCLPGGREDGAA